MTTILEDKDSANGDVMYMALELSNTSWKIGFSDGSRFRIKTIEPIKIS